MTSEYIRVSLAYRMAKGELASSSVSAVATRGPPSRRPSTHASGSDSTLNSADGARTANAPVPNTDVQPCRSR
jgi:hypothetical protein